MLLQHIVDRNLLEPRKDTNVFSDICSEPARTKVVSQMVRSLRDKPALKSEFHVRVALEALGSCWSLALTEDNIAIMETSLMIYKRWLRLSSAADLALKVPDEPTLVSQFFYQETIKHLSVAFEKRTIPKGLGERHNSLCKEIICTYNLIATERHCYLSDATWEVFLRVIMGIADLYLLEKPEQNATGEQLTGPLVECVFNLFLYSGSQSPALFDSLSDLAASWTHRYWVIASWHAILQGLTKRLLRVLYGTHYGFSAKIVRSEDESLETLFGLTIEDLVVVRYPEGDRPAHTRLYRISDEQVLYLWYRIILLFERRRLGAGSETLTKGRSLFPDPRLYLKYTRLMADVLDELAMVGKTRMSEEAELAVDLGEMTKATSIQVLPRGAQCGALGKEFAVLYRLP